MRATRILLAVSISSLVAIAVACGGDDNNNGGGGGGSDASTDTSTLDTGAADTGGGATATAGDVDVYAGQTASLDASGSSPAGGTFAWTLTSAPAGSHVTTASIGNASTAKPTIPTDVVGDYVLQVTVTSGSSSATASPKVHAHPGKIAFAHAVGFDDGGVLSEVQVVHSDGTGRATISCSTSYNEVPADGTLGVFGVHRLITSLDWYEGKPQDPAHVVYGFREMQDDAGYTNYLAVADESSRCTGTPAQKFDVFTNTGDMPRGLRISPNGDRVAYMRNDGSSGLVLVTMGLDGSNQRILGPVFVNDVDGGALVPASLYLSVPVQWLDETHVAWLAYASDAMHWAVISATDSATPDLSPVITCEAFTNNNSTTEPTVTEFSVLPAGDVLAIASLNTLDAGSSGANLVRLHPNSSTKQCELVGTIGQGVTDFAVAPDHTTLIVTMNSDLYYASVDGLFAPSLVPGVDGGIDAFGSRFIAGGALISTTGNFTVTDGGSDFNVMTLAPDGGIPDVIVSGSNDETFVPGSNVGTCSIAVGRASSLAAPFAAIGGIFALVSLRARRRRKKKSDVS